MVKKKKKKTSLVEIRYIVATVIVVMVVFLIVVLNNGSKITKPEFVVEPNNTWNKSAIVKITKDSIGKNRIVGYMYCINTEDKEDSCDWKQTVTKNFEIYQNGVNYVFIKGLDEEDNLSKAVKTIVRIDNDAPNIVSVDIVDKKENEITVKTDAFDAISSIKYYYSINNGEFVEGNNTYTYNNLESNTKYSIRVKVVDEALNEKEIGFEETTK